MSHLLLMTFPPPNSPGAFPLTIFPLLYFRPRVTTQKERDREEQALKQDKVERDKARREMGNEAWKQWCEAKKEQAMEEKASGIPRYGDIRDRHQNIMEGIKETRQGERWKQQNDAAFEAWAKMKANKQRERKKAEEERKTEKEREVQGGIYNVPSFENMKPHFNSKRGAVPRTRLNTPVGGRPQNKMMRSQSSAEHESSIYKERSKAEMNADLRLRRKIRRMINSSPLIVPPNLKAGTHYKKPILIAMTLRASKTDKQYLDKRPVSAPALEMIPQPQTELLSEDSAGLREVKQAFGEDASAFPTNGPASATGGTDLRPTTGKKKKKVGTGRGPTAPAPLPKAKRRTEKLQPKAAESKTKKSQKATKKRPRVIKTEAELKKESEDAEWAAIAAKYGFPPEDEVVKKEVETAVYWIQIKLRAVLARKKAQKIAQKIRDEKEQEAREQKAAGGELPKTVDTAGKTEDSPETNDDDEYGEDDDDVAESDPSVATNGLASLSVPATPMKSAVEGNEANENSPSLVSKAPRSEAETETTNEGGAQTEEDGGNEYDDDDYDDESPTKHKNDKPPSDGGDDYDDDDFS
jgi:hypothetical protein